MGSEPLSATCGELVEEDPDANAPVIAQRLRRLGFDVGLTIVKDYVRALRKYSLVRRAYVPVEPRPVNVSM